jgi:aldehyde:ferredoxin oxidoreductase
MAEIKIQYLEVDLTTGTSKVVDATALAKQYFGGWGLGTKLMWDQMPKGMDALDPNAVVFVGCGPVSGLVGSKTCIAHKSPLTNWAGESSLSGDFAWEMVSAGYNAGILLKGKAPKLSYLYVYDDKVEVRDATALKGKWMRETEETIQSQLNKETGEIFSVIVNGPAGENLVRIANVTTQYIHSGSKCGPGASFGAKNLKAIAVKGKKGPTYADHKAVNDLWMSYATSPVTALHRTGESRWGHYRSLQGCLRHVVDPFKNAHGSYNDFPDINEGYSFHLMNLRHTQWPIACHGCAAACFMPYVRRDERGTFAGEYRHGNSAGQGANLLLPGWSLCETSAIIDEVGLEGEESGCLVAWAIDLYDAKIISQADCDGLIPKYGDLDFAVEFHKKIALRQGKAANAMAEGFYRAMKVFGDASIPYAWHVQGQARPRYDARHKVGGNGLSNATACGAGSALNDSLTICNFAITPFSTIMGGNNAVAQKFWNAATGQNISTTDINNIVRRNELLGRCYSLREGFDITKDYDLPPRAFSEPIKDRYGNSWVWTRDEFEAAKKSRFTTTMGLTDKGLPKEAELNTLGLGFCVDTLKPMGLVG